MNNITTKNKQILFQAEIIMNMMKKSRRVIFMNFIMNKFYHEYNVV